MKVCAPVHPHPPSQRSEFDEVGDVVRQANPIPAAAGMGGHVFGLQGAQEGVLFLSLALAYSPVTDSNQDHQLAFQGSSGRCSGFGRGKPFASIGAQRTPTHSGFE
jgi:hypothetical protein